MGFAPSLQRWKISAFIQAEKDLKSYEEAKDKPHHYQGVSIRVSDAYFKVLERKSNSNLVAIQVLLKNFIVFKDHPKLSEAVDTVVEHLIGEKAFANQLAFVEIAQLTSKDMRVGLPLYQLNAILVQNKEGS